MFRYTHWNLFHRQSTSSPHKAPNSLLHMFMQRNLNKRAKCSRNSGALRQQFQSRSWVTKWNLNDTRQGFNCRCNRPALQSLNQQTNQATAACHADKLSLIISSTWLHQKWRGSSIELSNNAFKFKNGIYANRSQNPIEIDGAARENFEINPVGDLFFHSPLWILN